MFTTRTRQFQIHQCAALVVATALSFASAPVLAANVLLLGDDFSQSQVQARLELAGHNVTCAGPYYAWDGSGLSCMDSVIYLDGYNCALGMLPEADAALAAFVAGGGRLIMTEWTAWDAHNGQIGPQVSQLMAVTSPNASYAYGTQWQVLDEQHPLAANLPPSWPDDAGWSIVVAHPNATVVIQSSAGYPLLAYRTDVGGAVVHVNHDMAATTSQIHPNALQILVNAVEAPLQASREVLVLGIHSDDFGESQVIAALEAAGYAVTHPGFYFLWDGSGLESADAVIFLDNLPAGMPLLPEADAALAAYVSGGGRLIMTEAAAWDAYYGGLGPQVIPLMAVSMPEDLTGQGNIWTVRDTGNSLVQCVPSSWFDEAFWTLVVPHPAATVVIEGDGGNPLLAYRTDVGGAVVHVNELFLTLPGILGDPLNPNALRLLVDAVAAPLGCTADVNGDGAVNVTDLLALLAAWGTNPGHPADLDGDGTVGVTDLLALLGGWGMCV